MDFCLSCGPLFSGAFFRAYAAIDSFDIVTLFWGVYLHIISNLTIMRIELDDTEILPIPNKAKKTKRWKVTIPKTSFIVLTVTDDNGTNEYKFPKTAKGNKQSIDLCLKLRKDREICPYNINTEIAYKLRKERNKIIDKEEGIEKTLAYYTKVLEAANASVDKYTALLADSAKIKSKGSNTTRLKAYTVKQSDYRNRLINLNAKLQKLIEIRHAIIDKLTPVQTLLSTLNAPGPISVTVKHI